jgi:hypothetical protein
MAGQGWKARRRKRDGAGPCHVVQTLGDALRAATKKEVDALEGGD